MITKITDVSQYQALFKKAWNELQARNLFSNAELEYYASCGDTFTCLEDYFTKIGSLMTVEAGSAYPTKINYWNSASNTVGEKDSPVYTNVPSGEAVAISTKYEFIMLPLNEEYLEINADTREINIPTSFKKLVGVEGDHFAETLIFSIDRFFDYIDLLNDMQIYIEWKDKNGTDRYTPVSMIHYNASSGKILFGWPLSKEVTENAGTVQFAVRFFKQSEVADADGNKIILYSFSTKPHTLTIAKAIRQGLNTSATVDSAANTFLNAIKDSPSSNAPEAPIPVFSNPGEDLDPELDITDAEYTLTVQAVAEGTGHITYSSWWYQDENGNPAQRLTGVEEYRVFNPQPTARNAKEVYYVQTAPGIYEEYAGGWEEDDLAAVVLYERIYTYTIPSKTPGQDITGTYRAVAYNRTGRNVSADVYSSECRIPGPGTITLTQNLPTIASVGEEVKVEIETNSKNNVTYTWKYGNTISNTTSQPVLNLSTALGTSNSPTIIEPGWYQVQATATRNRKSVSTEYSNICKVTVAEPPVIQTITTSTTPLEQNVAENTSVNLVVAASFDSAYNNMPTELYTDNLIYTWYGMLPDGNYEVINDTNRATYRVADTSALNTNTLTVTGIGEVNGINDSAIAYCCGIKNHLLNKNSAQLPVDPNNMKSDGTENIPIFVIR